MDKSNFESGPRAGPRKGESRTSGATTPEVCPTYYGGGKNCFGAGQTAQSRQNDIREDSDTIALSDVDMEIKEMRRKTRTASPAPWRIFSSPERSRSVSGESGTETAVPTSPAKESLAKQFRKRPTSEPVESGSDKERERSPTGKSRGARSKRGRGRPPTTGEYVGLAQAKREHAAAEREAMAAEADRDIAEMARRTLLPRITRLSESSCTSDATDGDVVTASSLGAQITAGLSAITDVARKSRNLSGPCVKALKDATGIIQEAAAALLCRSSTAETKALESANQRLSKELADLRKELDSLKLELVNARPRTVPTAPQINVEELLQRAVREAVTQSSARLDARIEGLEARLLPQPRIRPPLAADSREPTQVVSTLMPPTNPGSANRGKSRVTADNKKRATRRDQQEETPSSNAPTASYPADQPQTGPETWSKVVSRKSKAKAKKSEQAKQDSGREQKRREPEKKKSSGKKGKNGKLRPPKSAAVVISLNPGAVERGVTYADVMGRAKQRLDIHALDIAAVRFRQSMTGARILEVSGAENKKRADALAEKLREVLGADDVQVSRPLKCADLRITGLDDTATGKEVAEAIAKAVSCPDSSIKTGEIRRDRIGRGSIWVSCPIEAAAQLAKDGKIYVGWTAARVVLLPSRGLRCYRCQESGHTSAKCACEVDRTGLCFRCGQPGHISAHCTGALHCAVCATHGQPANHRVGSQTCEKNVLQRKTGNKSRRPDKAPAPAAAAPGASSGEAMETQ